MEQGQGNPFQENQHQGFFDIIQKAAQAQQLLDDKHFICYY